jgi:hypothetical protein
MNRSAEPSYRSRARAWLARMRDAPGYVSVPVGVLFILGGVFSFLPVLGPWMLPVGLAILAPRVPIARKVLRRSYRLLLKWKLIRVKRTPAA